MASIYFQHTKEKLWRRVEMVVDTGADYTLLPNFLAPILGINLKSDCIVIVTYGVGGKSTVYLLKKKIKINIGDYTRQIPLGFLSHDNIPPLLGRQEFLETFKVIFENHITTFE